MDIKPKQKTKFSIIKSPTKKNAKQKSITNNKNNEKRTRLIKLIEEDLMIYRQSDILFNTESQNEINKKYKIHFQMEEQFFYNSNLSTSNINRNSLSILNPPSSTKSNSNSQIYNNTIGPFGEGSFSLKRLNSKEEKHKSSFNSEMINLNLVSSSKKGSYKQEDTLKSSNKYSHRKSETLAYLINEYNNESKIRNEVIKNISLLKMNVSNRKLNKEKTIKVSCNNIIKNIVDKQQFQQWNNYIQNQINENSRKNKKYCTLMNMNKNKKFSKLRIQTQNQKSINNQNEDCGNEANQFINMRDKGVFFNLINNARKTKVADFLKVIYFSKEELYEKSIQKRFNYLYGISENVKNLRNSRCTYESKRNKESTQDKEYKQIQSILPLSPIKERLNETDNLRIKDNTKDLKLFNKKSSFPEEILSFLNFKEIKFDEANEINSAKLVFENKISNEEGKFKYDNPSEIRNVLNSISNEGSLIESRRLLMMFDYNRLNLEIDIKTVDENEEVESKTYSNIKSEDDDHSVVTEGWL